eukprot:6292611-Lingulodinium_polyedra.AAC.1
MHSNNPSNAEVSRVGLPKHGIFKSGLSNASEPGDHPSQTKTEVFKFPASRAPKPASRNSPGLLWHCVHSTISLLCAIRG